MILHVTGAEYRGGYRIRVSFNDGSSGVVDLGGRLTGSMFEPLVDKDAFMRFRVDAELGTIVWDNGADLAPEYLRGLLKPGRGSHKKNEPCPRKARERRSAPSGGSLRAAKELNF